MTNKLVPIIKAMKREAKKNASISGLAFVDGYNKAIDDVIAMLSAAPSQWMPIESAPKDMTEVIVRCGEKDIRLGWYFAPSSQTKGWLDQNGKTINPTHWMPLPPAPEVV